MKCLLVGCGNMGGALLERWAQGLEANFTVLDPMRLSLPSDVPQVTAVDDLDGLFDCIILAVKPQMMDSVCPSLVLHKARGGLVISIAAGTTLDTLNRLMGPGPKIRLMPNLAAKLGLGLSALTATSPLSGEHKRFSEALAASVGQYLWVSDDEGIDRFTALAGSGPGYVFELMRSLESAANAQGFSAKDSHLIAESVFQGAAAYAAATPDQSFADLRDAVTSKGGTTEAGLSVMMKDSGAESMLQGAVEAAVQRARVLANS